jgi:hypothetical protein
MADKVLPKPCNGPKYADWTEVDQLLKVGEEYGEINEAYLKLRRCTDTKQAADLYIKLMEECTDLITAVTSFMDKMQFDENMRQQMQRHINHSNSIRDNGTRFRMEDV